jgi:hypothetical protein
MDSVSGELQVLYFDPMSHILWHLLLGYEGSLIVGFY